MKYITDGVRVDCVCCSWVFRGFCTAQIMKIAQNAFLNAPFNGEGRAFSHGWGALLAISSSPLVPCGRADRRGVIPAAYQGSAVHVLFLSISLSLSINLSIYLYSISIYLSIYCIISLSVYLSIHLFLSQNKQQYQQ